MNQYQTPGKISWIVPSFSALLALTLAGCGKAAPATGVSMVSKGYVSGVASAAPAPLRWLSDFLMPSAMATVSGITDFKFCITQMKVEAQDGTTVKENGTDLLEAKLGLVDLGSGSLPVSWGSLNIPTGTAIKRIKIEIHKDQQLCGVAYSTAITASNGTVLTVTQDIELKFAFANAKALNVGDKVTVSLANLASQYSAAVLAGKFDDQNLGAYMQTYTTGPEDSAE